MIHFFCYVGDGAYRKITLKCLIVGLLLWVPQSFASDFPSQWSLQFGRVENASVFMKV